MNAAELLDRLASQLTPMTPLGLRQQTEGDWPLLRDLFVARRWAEVSAAPGWSDGQRLAFLHSQAQLQQQHYATQHADAGFLVVEHQRTPIGRLCVQVGEQAAHVVDIALLPAWQRQGLGSALLRAVLAVCDQRQAACTLNVDSFSPARQLYRRLGFIDDGEQGFAVRMQRLPSLPRNAQARPNAGRYAPGPATTPLKQP